MKMKRGAIGMNIILFLVVAAALLYLVGWGSSVTDVFAFIGLVPSTGAVSSGTLLLTFGGLLLGVAIIVGTFSFPNPYAIFAPIALVLGGIVVGTWGNFLEAAGFPTMDIAGVGTNVPVVSIVVGLILAALGGLSVIAFLKGGEW